MKDNGYKVRLILCGTVLAIYSQRYEVKYEDLNFNQVDYDVVLVESDFINDNHLVEIIKDNLTEIADGIVCWLLGTHNMRGNNSLFNTAITKNSSDARTKTILKECFTRFAEETIKMKVVSFL